VTKPPYRIPSMREISEIPWNGYTAVSTFSGCAVLAAFLTTLC